MGTMNRAQRRRQEQEQMRAWRRRGEMERVLSIQKNGISSKDLDKSYKDGYEAGYMYAAEGFMKKMYAAIAKQLHEAGTEPDEIVQFVKAVDERFALMFDADEEIEDIYQLIGVHFNVDRYAVRRIEEGAR